MKFSALISLATLVVSTAAFAAESVIEGKITKVVPEKREIYVRGKDDGKKHEYYFNDKTEVLKMDAKQEFSALSEGMNVRVTANKKGKRLDPMKVEILPPQ